MASSFFLILSTWSTSIDVTQTWTYPSLSSSQTIDDNFVITLPLQRCHTKFEKFDQESSNDQRVIQ